MFLPGPLLNSAVLRRTGLCSLLLSLVCLTFYLLLDIHPLNLYSLLGVIAAGLFICDLIKDETEEKEGRLGSIFVGVLTVVPLLITVTYFYPGAVEDAWMSRAFGPPTSSMALEYTAIIGLPVSVAFGFILYWSFLSTARRPDSGRSFISTVAADAFDLAKTLILLALSSIVTIVPALIEALWEGVSNTRDKLPYPLWKMLVVLAVVSLVAGSIVELCKVLVEKLKK